MNIYIEGYFNCNLGDDLFFYTLLKRYKDVDFYTCTNNLYNLNLRNLHFVKYNRYINKILQILKLDKYSKKNKIIKKMDAIIILGGSMFIESKNKRDNYKYNYLKKCNKPFFIIGSNFGPFSSKSFLLNQLEILKLAKDITVRDNKSFNLLSKDITNIRVAPDIIFSINKDSHVLKKNNKILVSLINTKNRRINDELYIKSISNIINYFSKLNYEICLMSFCKNEGDEEEIEKICKSIKNEKIQKYYYRGNIHETLDIIKESDIIVGSRFHANILGLAFNKIIIPLAYSDKTIDALKDINFKGKIYDLRKNEEIILNDEIILNEEIAANNIKNNQKFFKDCEDEHFKVLDSFIREG